MIMFLQFAHSAVGLLHWSLMVRTMKTSILILAVAMILDADKTYLVYASGKAKNRWLNYNSLRKDSQIGGG